MDRKGNVFLIDGGRCVREDRLIVVTCIYFVSLMLRVSVVLFPAASETDESTERRKGWWVKRDAGRFCCCDAAGQAWI